MSQDVQTKTVYCYLQTSSDTGHEMIDPISDYAIIEVNEAWLLLYETWMVRVKSWTAELDMDVDVTLSLPNWNCLAVTCSAVDYLPDAEADALADVDSGDVFFTTVPTPESIETIQLDYCTLHVSKDSLRWEFRPRDGYQESTETLSAALFPAIRERLAAHA